MGKSKIRRGECLRCEFFLDEGTHMNMGLCFRHAPRPTIEKTGEGSRYARWPRVHEREGCGDWVPIRDPKL